MDENIASLLISLRFTQSVNKTCLRSRTMKQSKLGENQENKVKECQIKSCFSTRSLFLNIKHLQLWPGGALCIGEKN